MVKHLADDQSADRLRPQMKQPAGQAVLRAMKPGRSAGKQAVQGFQGQFDPVGADVQHIALEIGYAVMVGKIEQRSQQGAVK